MSLNSQSRWVAGAGIVLLVLILGIKFGHLSRKEEITNDARKVRLWPSVTSNAALFRAPESRPAATVGAPAASRPVSSQLAELARLETSEGHAAYLAIARARVERESGHLFQRLRGISPETRDALIGLLAESSRAERMAVLTHIDEADPIGAGQRLQIEMRRLAAQRDEQVSALLKPEEYSQYKDYNESFAYRDTIGEVTSIMRSKGFDISEERQEVLLDAYAKAISAATRDAVAAAGSGETKAQQIDRLDRYLANTFGNILTAEEYREFMAAQMAQSEGPR